MSNLKPRSPKPTTKVFHPRMNELRCLKSRLVKETRDLQLKQALGRITTLEACCKHLNALLHARLSDDIDFREEFEKMRVDMKKMKKAGDRHFRYFDR